jgi:hypothetical protein
MAEGSTPFVLGSLFTCTLFNKYAPSGTYFVSEQAHKRSTRKRYIAYLSRILLQRYEFFSIFAAKYKKMISKNQIKLIRALELKKNRKREGLFVAEGPKVVGDLLQAGYLPRMIFSTTERPDAELITEEELHKISFLQHPQEVLARRPGRAHVHEAPQQPPLPLVREGRVGAAILGHLRLQLPDQPLSPFPLVHSASLTIC